MWRHQLDYGRQKFPKNELQYADYGAPSLTSAATFGSILHAEIFSLYKRSHKRIAADTVTETIRAKYAERYKHEITFDTALLIEEPLEMSLRDAGWTAGVTASGYEVDPDETFTSTIDSILDLRDPQIAFASKVRPGIKIVDLKTSDGDMRNGRLWPWTDEGLFFLSFQGQCNLLLARHHGFAVDGFWIRRLQRCAPFQMDTHEVPLPDPIMEEAPALIAEAIGRDNHIMQMTERKEPAPRTGIALQQCCTPKQAFCPHVPVCSSESKKDRRRRLRTLYT